MPTRKLSGVPDGMYLLLAEGGLSGGTEGCEKVYVR